jgi:hypothetical protein
MESRSKTRYEMCKKSIKTYMKKNPEALKNTQKKYLENNKEDIKEYQKIYHRDYYHWKIYLDNTSYKYERTLYLQILLYI